MNTEQFPHSLGQKAHKTRINKGDEQGRTPNSGTITEPVRTGSEPTKTHNRIHNRTITEYITEYITESELKRLIEILQNLPKNLQEEILKRVKSKEEKK